MKEQIDTVIIGGGQVGLVVSYYLKQQNCEHVVLEKERIGEAWRSAKWDSFTLATPIREFKTTGDSSIPTIIKPLVSNPVSFLTLMIGIVLLASKS